MFLRFFVFLILWLVIGLGPTVAFSDPPAAWRVVGEGVVVESAHPKRPGDIRDFATQLKIALDERTGEGRLDFFDTQDTSSPATTYYWRRGRLFQSNADQEDLPAEGYNDLSSAAIAVLHPKLLATYLRERPENADTAFGMEGSNLRSTFWFAMGDVLWFAELSPPVATATSSLIHSLTRTVHNDIDGMMLERIQYSESSVTVTRSLSSSGDGVRTVARFQFGAPESIEPYRTPKGDPRRDAAMVIPPEEFRFRDLGGGLFACELAQPNARVFVVEFEDELLVFEGLFSSRNAETMAAAVRDRFRKPVSHFAFSHIHPQYLAGVRAWASQDATILVPPTSVPSVTSTLAARFDLRPDAWSRTNGTPRIETVAKQWSREDSSASVVILNDLKSDHTDEYFVVYMPRTRTLLTGDLLFYRPGQPLRNRSLTLARYVRELGLEVERYVTTWPLEWPGKNDLTGEELRSAAAAGEAAEPAKK